ncbi:MAG: division/cell wall cluster transcriptional repressor MraZ [Reyranellaceae bacterium]
MFLSTYLMKVDGKGRVSVPAAWRAHLSNDGFDGFIAFQSLTHTSIDARGKGGFGQLMAKLRSDSEARAGTLETELFVEGDNDAAYLSSVAIDVSFDSEGRLSLPATLWSALGVTNASEKPGQLAFVGRSSYFQIWTASAWAAQSERERERFLARVAGRRVVPLPGDGR